MEIRSMNRLITGWQRGQIYWIEWEKENRLAAMEKVGQQAGYSKVKEEDWSTHPLTGL